MRAAWLAMLLLGCNPDLPSGRDCSSQADCFADERCVAQSCTLAALLPDAVPSMPREDAATEHVVDAGLGDAQTPDAKAAAGDMGPDPADMAPETPDLAPPDAAPTPDASSDAAPDGAAVDGGPDGALGDAGPDGALVDGGPDGAAGDGAADGAPQGDSGAADGAVPLADSGQMMVPDAAPP